MYASTVVDRCGQTVGGADNEASEKKGKALAIRDSSKGEARHGFAHEWSEQGTAG